MASLAATALGVPLVIYAGLGGRHGPENARHWMFALEGMRDFDQQLCEHGQHLVARVPSDPDQPSPVYALGLASALTVVDDFACPQSRGRYERLAPGEASPGVGVPVWAVDCACVVPLGTLGERPERAYKFRDKTRKARKRELGRAWPAFDLAAPAAREILRPGAVAAGAPNGHAARLDWDSCVGLADATDADLRAMVARARIAHAVLPVGDTRGGTAAGYQRWEAFKAAGLRSYHKKRNDAAIGPNGADGSRAAVSRMSAYLHYGMVSPFRLAREADAIRRDGSEGAEKYLDELLVWRELAQHWMHHGGRGDIHGVPAWARETLEKHEDDPRPVLHAKTTLERGETGDELWDLAQKSLIRHGELHNNLRMTWGKALLQWTRAHEVADRLEHLNNTYALDGSDPSSYGGLWWCLGLLDRPFEPEQPVIGSLRPRDTASHAGRLDMDGYRRVVGRHQPGRPERVAVIGAGVAGMTAARILADHGSSVTVFEKARGPGGRMSTRRSEHGCFDHGCAVFSAAPGSEFDAQRQRWTEVGLVEPVAMSEQGPDGSRGTEGANTLLKAFASDLAGALPAGSLPPNELRYQSRVASIERHQETRWMLRDDDGEAVGVFDAVIVTAPPPQAAELLRPIDAGAAERIAAIMAHAQWTAMVALAQPSGVEIDRLVFGGDEVLGKALRMPMREADTHERWVIHASAAWAAAHLEIEKDEAARHLWSVFADQLRARGGSIGEPAALMGHRWRYAFCEGEDFTEPIAPGLAVAGDWAWSIGDDDPRDLTQTGVERAWRSGCRAALLVSC